MNSPFVFGSRMASTPMSPKCPFTFEDGSTRIIVTWMGTRVVGSVSPHAIALTSPVWKKFVFPPFRKTSAKGSGSMRGIDNTLVQMPEGNKSTVEPVEELDFTNDPAEALLILLRIAHFQFTSIPSILSTASLSEVAILCDQYDCVHLVKPWLAGWLARENLEWRQPLPIYQEKWLFIAWVFGREKILKDLASVLVLEIQMIENGKCLQLTDRWDPMPPGLIESILRVRRVMIEKLLEIPRKCIERFSKTSNVLCLRNEKPATQLHTDHFYAGLISSKSAQR